MGHLYIVYHLSCKLRKTNLGNYDFPRHGILLWCETVGLDTVKEPETTDDKERNTVTLEWEALEYENPPLHCDRWLLHFLLRYSNNRWTWITLLDLPSTFKPHVNYDIFLTGILYLRGYFTTATKVYTLSILLSPLFLMLPRGPNYAIFKSQFYA